MGRRLKVRNLGTSILIGNAAGDKIDCGADFIGTGAISITGWIKPRSFGASNAGRILDNGQFILNLRSTIGDLNFTSNGSTTIDSASNSIKLGTWQFVTITRDAAGIANLYINGVLSGTANQNSGTPGAATTNVIIGNNAGGTRNFNGNLDALRIFNRVLTPIEIANLYYLGQDPNDYVTSILAHYKFDEGGGTTTADSSPNGHTGTITSAIFSTDVLVLPRLKWRGFGTSLNFTAASDKVDLGADFLGSGDITVSAWINPRTGGASNGGRIIDNGRFVLSYSSPNKLFCESDGVTPQTSLTGSILLDGKWKFVTVTRDATGLTNLYVNGIPVSNVPNGSTGTPVNGTNNLTIGNNAAGTRNFDGKIDSLRIFSKVLSQAEILALYLDGRVPSVDADTNIRVAEYLFNEGSGTVATDSGPFAHTGTITGATYSNEVPSSVRTIATPRLKVRDFGSALIFDGASSKIDCGAGSASINLRTGNTVSLWFKTNSKTGDTELVSKGIGTGYPFTIRYETNFSFSFKAFDGTNTSSITTSVNKFNDGRWHQFVGVLDKGNTLSGYVDGVLFNSTADITTTIPDNGLNIGIGYRTGSTKFFKGLIDSVRIWNRPLSSTEVANLYYNGTFSNINNGLVSQYLLNEGSGTIAIDSSPSGNNGTITSAAYTSTDVPIIPRSVI